MKAQTGVKIVPKVEMDKEKAEITEMLSKFGWKWAVMASVVGEMYQKGEIIPNNILQKLRTARLKIESGCYSVCETACDLGEIESELFPHLTRLGKNETDRFLELSSKAVNGTINEDDLNLSGIKPILSECISLPCVCLK